MKRLLVGSTLYALLLLPFVRLFLESNMSLHMLVQMPGLVVTGWFVGKYLMERFPNFFMKWNGNGIPGIILFVFVTTYWMIPRAMDDSLVLTLIEVLKYTSLPIVGLLLADSWGKIKGVGRAFIFLNYLSMFGLMGWLYIDAPIQMCNSYLISEQQTLGWAFLGVTGLMVVYTLVMVFSDRRVEV